MSEAFLADGRIVLFDGGIGTELYERGFYINRPFEELNISAPREVQAVHESYLQAGAEVITTNSFSITRPQLKKFDIEDQQAVLIRAALGNARQAVRNSAARIAFSMGPLGVLIEPLGPTSVLEAQEEFRVVAQIAVCAGAFDFYILETFTNPQELLAAVRGIRAADPARPILASMALKSTQDALIEDFARLVGDSPDVQYLGLNCSEGPSDVFSTLKKLLPRVNKPVVVQPNAGVPRQLNGRYFYMTSPDYMAKYAKRFAEAGASGIGGCCGTGPLHIKAIRNALRMMNAKRFVPPTPVVSGGVSNAAPAAKDGIDPGTRPSGILATLRRGERVISIEVLPPKGTDLQKFTAGLEEIRAAGVSFVNCPDGARANTRVSSLHIAAFVNQAPALRGLSVIPHFTTRDRNLIALQSDLLGAFINGVRDLLIVTGDPPKLGNNKDATGVFDVDAIGLTYLTQCLNRGITPNGEDLGQGTGFGIGVASNPTAINLDTEIQRWRYKCESGADFAITQPIFDPDSFRRWRDRIGDSYRPHIVGIWPLVSLRNAEFMNNEIPGVHVPAWVLEEMAKSVDSPADAIARGVDISRRAMDSLRNECEGFCISAPLGKIAVALDALRV